MAFTYFFRDLHTLEHAVRSITRDFPSAPRVRVWDAGCAHGPEPYTLAILFAESMGHFAFRNLAIDATDRDGSDLFASIIADGVYPNEELERIPRELFTKYFSEAESRPGHHQIDERIRARVRFQKHDLLSLRAPNTGYHLILCKNVLLHFSPAERVEVIAMYRDALVPGGYFITEQTQKLPAEAEPWFDTVTGDAQIHRRR